MKNCLKDFDMSTKKNIMEHFILKAQVLELEGKKDSNLYKLYMSMAEEVYFEIEEERT